MKSEKFFGYWRDGSETPPKPGKYLTWIEYADGPTGGKGQYYILNYNGKWGLNEFWRCARWCAIKWPELPRGMALWGN